MIVAANLYLPNDGETDESSDYWAVYTRELMTTNALPTPDVVFSSEEYGPRWAAAMGVPHVMVDANRTIVPISATMIRSDPYHHWPYLNQYARQHYLKRVLVVGAESSGKTTLCQNLANAYGTVYAPEYGRIYDERTRSKGTEVDQRHERIIFADIVNQQPVYNARAEAEARLVCFYDTDLETTALWYKQWQADYGEDGLYHAIKQAASEEYFDLVLLQDLAPFVDDGMRGHKHDRETFLRRIHRAQADRCRNVRILTGSWNVRTNDAIGHVNKLFEGSRVTLPALDYDYSC